MSTLALSSGTKNNEKSYKHTASSKLALHKTDDLNNIIVMSGSAKRKRFEAQENHSPIRTNYKNDFKGSLLKLRAPFYKPHQKQAQMEEKLTTKSCEILFECIKPYKNIRMAKRTQVTQSVRAVRTMGSILTGDIVRSEKKATRKVQFLTYSEENSMQSVISHKQNFLQTLMPTGDGSETIIEKLEIEEEMEPGKTVSSEDFIKNVFSEPALI